ncbi:MAG: Amino acid/amide transporter ATP-binding protein 2, family [Amycolatopsis sp.]|jgi:ABC-type branched-subunit amino acid transport system ATPase component|uniref:ABC transporter ATP-binding protein n=1 Tax=Amycolatopsis sp. TaxID=37632 RepID=UPI0026225576|nr:ABC transporter ATP-binding protein [Amycolatopsis sp.]MCU1681422.1 Amino acid/amide transporter ATP-binding protein 2, family [Amycolatopsis sp.]
MIHIEGLWAGYGGLDILRGVDLRVERGSVNCIVGPNGAGKSTVLKTISGLLRPRRGSIVIDGADLGGTPPATVLHAGVVQVPQKNALFAKLTVRDNVLMGGYIHRRRSKDLERRYGQLAEQFPLLGERPDAPAGSLSGGQRRTVEFARALMLEPKVVLLDEPTLGLDPLSLGIVRDSVLALHAGGVTVLMVEQNVRFGLALADRATVMSAGRVVLTGTAAEIRDKPDLMDVFFGAARPGERAVPERTP